MVKPRFMGKFDNGTKPTRPLGAAQAQQPEQTPEQPKEETPKQEVPETPKSEEPKTPVEQPEKPTQDTKETATGKPSEEKPKDVATEVDEAKLLETLNKRSGKNFRSLDEYWAEKEKPEEKPKNKEVQLLERYLEKNPGKTSKDFFDLQKDWNSVPDIEVLRQKQRSEYGSDLSNEDADILIKKQLGIDLEEDLSDLDKADSVTLMSNAKKYKKELTSKQEEALKALEVEDKPDNKESRPDRETVTLIDGTEISKDQYTKAREQYLSENKRIASETKEHSFKFQYNNGEGMETIDIPYVLTDDDREHILSATETVTDPTVFSRYKTKDGDFDIAAYQKAKLFELRGEKIVEILVSNAYSQGLERAIKEERNISFKPGSQRPTKPGEKQQKVDVSRLPGSKKSFGPRFQLNKN